MEPYSCMGRLSTYTPSRPSQVLLPCSDSMLPPPNSHPQRRSSAERPLANDVSPLCDSSPPGTQLFHQFQPDRLSHHDAHGLLRYLLASEQTPFRFAVRH
jgi:hypothetical protein